MQLTLRVQSYCGDVPDNNRERVYDSFPVIVGRSTSCEYVLSDPSKYISSNHATLYREDDQVVVEDTSANGLYVNGSEQALGKHNRVRVNHGDLLTIGDYTIALELSVPHTAESPDDTATAHDTRDYDPFKGDAPDWPDSTPGSSADIFGDSRSDTPSGDPFGDDEDDEDDWLKGFGESAKHTPVSTATADAPPPTAPASSIDTMDDDADSTDSDDPFRWLQEQESEPAQAKSQHETDTYPAPISGSGAVSLEGTGQTRSPDPWPEEPTPAEPVKEETVKREPAQQQQDINRERAAPPEPVQRATPHRTPPPQPGAPTHSGGLDTLLHAAGLNPGDFAHLNEQEAMQQIGLLLSQSVNGIMLLLQSRQEIKQAIRSDVTMLAGRNNNPLKFSFGSQEALTKLLLSQKNPGYLPAEEAINQAVDDLKAHQVATLEAMRSAVKAMLAQFDPERLERKLEKKNRVAANIPIKREAKLWELFQERFEDIHDEAVSNFGEMFATEFRKAYESRIRELGRNPDF